MPIRDATKDDLLDMQPVVSQTSGINAYERFNLEVLANDPEAAKLWLRGRGYQVMQHGKGFNFAVRRSSEDPWQVTDPEGLDMGDILLGFLPNLALGAVTEIGRKVGAAGLGIPALSGGPVASAAGGLIGQTIGAGGVGALEDVAVQGAGLLTGVNQEFDPFQTAVVGGVSAALPGAFVLGGATTRTAARAVGGRAKAGLSAISKRLGLPAKAKAAKEELKEFMAGFAGFPDLFALPAGRQMARRAQTLPFELPSLKDGVDITRQLMEKVTGKQFKEDIALGELVAPLTKIDITDEIGALVRASARKIPDEAKKSAFENARNEILGLAGMSPTATFSGVGGRAKVLPSPRDVVAGRQQLETVLGRGRRTKTGREFVTTRISSKTGRPEDIPVLVDGETALEIKRIFANVASDAGIFDQRFLTKLGKSAEKATARSADSIRGKIRGALVESDRAVFDQVNEAMELKLRTVTRLERSLGGGTVNPSRLAVGAQRDPVSPDAFFKSFFNDTNSTARRAVKEFDRVFEAEIEEFFETAIKNTPVEELMAAGLMPTSRRVAQIAEDARTGATFGESTLPNLRPPFTAVGQLRGTAIGASAGAIPGATIGLAVGGPAGAAVGGGVGAVLGGIGGTLAASPRLLTAGTRALQDRAPQAAVRRSLARLQQTFVARNLPPAMRSEAFALFQQQAKQIMEPLPGKPIVREDKSAMRKELEGN